MSKSAQINSILAFQWYLCLPHEPELEDVHVAPTLDGHVPGVVGHVILLVGLEQVAGAHGVTAGQDALQETHTMHPG